MSFVQTGIVANAVLAGVGSGMMYVFSTGVMSGLGQLPQSEAVRAMQAINVAVINPLFLGVFMGTGLFAALVAGVHLASASASGSGPVDPWILGGAALYVVGVVGVTVFGNVPLNDALAALDAERLSPGAWSAYARPWLALNHVRAIAAALSSLCFVSAAMR